MKYCIQFFLILVFLTSCNDGDKKKNRILSDSSGNLNNLSVVVDNDAWNSEIGESIRNIFAAPVDGLPQKEPLFNINQIPTAVFSDFATKNRLILKIEKNPSKGVDFNNNTYAKPQKVVVVKGNSKTEIIEVLKENASKIITAFKDVEIKERKRQIAKSLSSDKAIKERLGITIKYPSVYRTAKEENNFFWLRKDITTGTTNIMLYEIPLDQLTIDSTLVQQIIKIRDSIGEKYIPGPTDGTFMKTEEAYSPFFYTTILELF